MNYTIKYYDHLRQAATPAEAVAICRDLQNTYGRGVQAPHIESRDAASARLLDTYQTNDSHTDF